MKNNFQTFISYFPTAKLPFILEAGSEHEFSMTNDALPQALIDEFIIPHLTFEIDHELTEFVPCVSWALKNDYIAIVVWCARLLQYSFIMMIFSKQGKLTDQFEIAGFFNTDDYITQRIANIDEEAGITMVEGSHGVTNPDFDEKKNVSLSLEIGEDGKIQFMPI